MFVVVLFVVSGASLNVSELVTGGTLALVYVLARFAGKSLGVMSLTYSRGVRRGAAGLLCLALTPMSGTAVGMVHRTAHLYPDFGAKLVGDRAVGGADPGIDRAGRGAVRAEAGGRGGEEGAR